MTKLSREFIKKSPIIHDAYGLNAHTSEIKKLFGLRPEQKWPKEGMPPRVIQGVQVWVLSVPGAKYFGRLHRVRCACLFCDKTLSLGRLHQHMLVHNKEIGLGIGVWP